MAKTSVKARQRKREKMVKQFAEKRKELKKAGNWQALDELPKNSSKVRLKNRCQISGRPRGYVRYFGISRIAMRDMALDGKIPGLKKQAGKLDAGCLILDQQYLISGIQNQK